MPCGQLSFHLSNNWQLMAGNTTTSSFQSTLRQNKNIRTRMESLEEKDL